MVAEVFPHSVERSAHFDAGFDAVINFDLQEEAAAGARSDMNWSAIESGKVSGILEHWRTLGQFRDRHRAVGAGKHTLISRQPYVFSRHYGNDRVVIAFGRKGS